ncbi:hypothetical protein QYF36_022208 [Acer negundo]|nr:hypothetical protein QYF36_022208 [Acer negundo]
MTREIGTFLGKMIRDFRGIDVGPFGECIGKYIRVRVVINVDESLRQIFRMDVFGDGKESTMLLRYEKLLDHCFRYGQIGHVVRECAVEATGSELEDFNSLFGPWLKVVSSVQKNDFRYKCGDAGNMGLWNGEANVRAYQNRARRDEMTGGDIQNMNVGSDLILDGDGSKGKGDSMSKSLAMAGSILSNQNHVARNLDVHLGEEILPLKEKIVSDFMGPKSQVSKTSVRHVENVKLGGDGSTSEPTISKVSTGFVEKMGQKDGKMQEMDGDSSNSVGWAVVLSAIDIDKRLGDIVHHVHAGNGSVETIFEQNEKGT